MRRFRWLAVLCVAALVAGACGRSDEGAEENDGSTTTAAANAASADFGTLKQVCQDGDPSGAPDQAVTATEVRVGTISDPGFSGRPGLNQEMFDAADVFVKWCNDNGGINGRKIKLDKLDAAITQYKPRILEACEQDFMLVGGGGVLDDTGTKDRIECLLPQIPGYVVSAEAREADLQVQPVPNGIHSYAVGDFRWIEEQHPDAVSKVAALTGELPAVVLVHKQGIEAAKKLGWNIVYDGRYNVAGEPTWVPIAQNLKSRGAKGLLWTGEPENLGKLIAALGQIDYQLDFIRADANHYDARLIDQAGPTLANTYVRSVFHPFEAADENPATQRYLELFEKYLPNGKAKALLGMQAFSAWLLWATAASKCGNDLTRRCVYDEAEKIHEWTGGGLHAVQDPGANTASECFSVLQATPDGFEPADVDANEGIYNCDPENVMTLTGDYGESVTLEDVGKTLDDL